MKPEIWVLGDNRAGTKIQAIALAEVLDLGYNLKDIRYNIWGKLPNFLLMINPIHIDRKFFKPLEGANLPEIIISAGRRTAPLALYLKKKSDNKLKVIQIMRPDCSYSQFDLMVIPYHDNIPQAANNIVRITGALNNIKAKIVDGGEELRKQYPEIKKFIAVIIGGNTKNYKFNISDINLFSSLLSKVSSTHSLPLFISFSRRTPSEAKQIIRANFSWPNIIYDPEEGGMNPYFGMLSCADYIISTADSISMCSEAASSGKPLYIFLPDDFNSKKHRIFIHQLIQLGIVRKLDNSVSLLENYFYKPLYEVEKVAQIIKSNFLL